MSYWLLVQYNDFTKRKQRENICVGEWETNFLIFFLNNTFVFVDTLKPPLDRKNAYRNRSLECGGVYFQLYIALHIECRYSLHRSYLELLAAG